MYAPQNKERKCRKPWEKKEAAKVTNWLVCFA